MTASEGWGVGFPDVDELLTQAEVRRERLNTDAVTDLWKAAATLTEDVAEQAWIVVHAVAAGWDPPRLLATGLASWVETNKAPAGEVGIDWSTIQPRPSSPSEALGLDQPIAFPRGAVAFVPPPGWEPCQ